MNPRKRSVAAINVVENTRRGSQWTEDDEKKGATGTGDSAIVGGTGRSSGRVPVDPTPRQRPRGVPRAFPFLPPIDSRAENESERDGFRFGFGSGRLLCLICFLISTVAVSIPNYK